MNSSVKVKAKFAKLSVDEKKATVTLELLEDSWGEIPELANMTGTHVDVRIADLQTRMDFDA